MKTIFLSIMLATAMSFSAFSQNVGDVAPDFTLDDIEGNTVNLNENKGKVVVLFFFGNTCSSCIAVAPEVQSKLQESFGQNDNFVLFGLDQWDGNKASLESFKSTTKVTFPLLQKASGTGSAFKTTYDRLVVINQDGIIAFKGTKLVRNDIADAVSTIQSLLVKTSVNELASDFNVEVFPNPAVSNLNIKVNTNGNHDVAISLIDITGKTVIPIKYLKDYKSNEVYSLSLDDIASGIYFANINAGNKQKMVRIIKR
jgi:peroxiredoxin